MLNNNGIRGALPKELFQLPVLENVLVYRNRLSGPIPESVGEAEQLRTFVAYGNQLSGRIPRQMGFPFKLRYLCVPSQRGLSFLSPPFQTTPSGASADRRTPGTCPSTRSRAPSLPTWASSPTSRPSTSTTTSSQATSPRASPS